ncbi:MAG: aminotransferase class I/II-fold pyridoxal phosphate-dependent enzyme [Bdellovibrionales bacterium]|nr:aminotransferase class I/II-fold pyridoxal phosphate-dependent enzyme [Bdellovibrionales bacterium]
MNIKLTPIVHDLKESATLAINQKALKLRNSGNQVFHFGFGQSPFPVSETLQSALRSSTSRKEYLPTRGLNKLHEVFVEYYNRRYDTQFQTDNIFVSPGSKELLFQILFLLDGPLLIPTPSWVSYGPQAHLCQKEAIYLPTKKEEGYKLTAKTLEHYCLSEGLPDQSILILNSPNNPTGSLYHPEELQALAGVCRRHNIIVISDEIYGQVDFTYGKFSSFAKWYPEGTIVSTGLSKGFSAGGYRLGILALPSGFEVLNSALKTMVSETFSAVSSPIQYAAVAAYEYHEDQEQFIQACTEIHRHILNFVYQKLIAADIGCAPPEGAFYLFPDFEKFKGSLNKMGIETSEKLCQFLLEKYHVALLPGSDFYMPAHSLSARLSPVDYDGSLAINEYLNGGELNTEFVQKWAPHVFLGCEALVQFTKDLTPAESVKSEL